MIAALFLFTATWFGLILDDEFRLSRGDRLVRMAAAIVLGAFCGAWIMFLLAWACGFTDTVILGGTGLLLGFNLCAWHYRHRNLAWLTTLPGLDREFWLASAIPTTLLTVYFGICVWTNAGGDILFRGNTRDLAFHMGTVSAFVEQSAFPPFNPQSAGARLSYHFMANFFSAILCKGGFDLLYALKIPMVLFAFSLSTLTCHLFYTVAKTRAATLFAALLFFFGHVGVVNVVFGLLGYPSGNLPLSLGSWRSIEDHITYPYYNFLNVIIDYFQPQLPFLAGFPVAMLLLGALYRKHLERTPADRTTYFLIGAVAFMPLFHMHTFLTLGPLVGLFVLCERVPFPSGPAASPGWFARVLDQIAVMPANSAETTVARVDAPARGDWLKVGVLCLAAIPVGLQLAFIFSQEKTAGFSGFDVAQHLGALPEIPEWLHLKRVWFWLRVAGPPLVLGLIGLGWWIRPRSDDNKQDRCGKTALLAVLAVSGIYFGIINVFRFTPNWGDSNKFVLYLNVLLCLCAGRWLAHLWGKSRPFKITTVVLIALGAVVPSGIEWAMRYRREPERLFSASDRVMAEWIKINTPKDAVFLTANSFVHLVPALAGRRVINGSYTRETGFADQHIEETVIRAYREADPFLITTARVTHVMVGPEELGLYRVNRAAFGRRHRLLYDQPSLNTPYTIFEAREPTVESAKREQELQNSRSSIGLSELEPTLAQQSFGTLKFDRAFNLDALSLKGRKYTSGLGTHATSNIHYHLGGNFTRFESDIGVDDSQIGSVGSVQFEVWVDDRKTYQSKILRAGDTPEKINMDISGGTVLRLVVTDGGDGDHCDHADWADARLTRK